MRDMVGRLRISLEDTRVPRFTRPGTKTFERNKRRLEIKKELFRKESESD
jgi:hypothetical protein